MTYKVRVVDDSQLSAEWAVMLSATGGVVFVARSHDVPSTYDEIGRHLLARAA